MEKPSQKSMKALKELQSLDLEIMLLEQEKETLPGEMVDLKQKMDALEKDISVLDGEIKTFVRERRGRESVLEEKLQVLEKLRSQKNMVATNEAYTALLKEIERAEQEKIRVEEDILMYMERAEEAATLMEDKKSGFRDCSAGMKIMEEKNRIRIGELEGKLSGLYEERGGKKAQIDGGLLLRYEKIKKAKGGLALVSVSGGLCRGCFMELRLQVISELIKGELITCDSCSRLLYWDGEKVECATG